MGADFLHAAVRLFTVGVMWGQMRSIGTYHRFRGECSDFALETLNCLVDIINLCHQPAHNVNNNYEVPSDL